MGGFWGSDDGTSWRILDEIYDFHVISFPIYICAHNYITAKHSDKVIAKQEMCFMEHGICPIATSIMNELFQ